MMFKLLSLLTLALLPLQLVSYDCPLKLEEGAHYEYVVEDRRYAPNTKLLLDVNNIDENGLMTVSCKMEGGWYVYLYNLRGEVCDSRLCSFHDFTVVLDVLRNSSDFQTSSFIYSENAEHYRRILFDDCKMLLDEDSEEFFAEGCTWTRELLDGDRVLFRGNKSIGCCFKTTRFQEIEINLRDGMLIRGSLWSDQVPVFEVRRIK